MLITFEGIDSSGKSTQCQLLAEFLMANGYDIIQIREPGGTSISEKIRRLLLDNSTGTMSPLTEFLLYSAARAQLVEQVIRPALASGKVVICDRFYDSSVAYQGHGRGLNTSDIDIINRISTGGLEPDLTLFIDIPVDEAVRRLKLAEKLSDRIESEGTAFFKRVRQGYLQIATQHGRRLKVIDGSDDIEDIRRRIQGLVIEKLGMK